MILRMHVNPALMKSVAETRRQGRRKTRWLRIGRLTTSGLAFISPPLETATHRNSKVITDFNVREGLS